MSITTAEFNGLSSKSYRNGISHSELKILVKNITQCNLRSHGWLSQAQSRMYMAYMHLFVSTRLTFSKITPRWYSARSWVPSVSLTRTKHFVHSVFPWSRNTAALKSWLAEYATQRPCQNGCLQNWTQIQTKSHNQMSETLHKCYNVLL